MVAEAHTSNLECLFKTLPTGWGRREGGILVGGTGVALATLNGVWVERVDTEMDRVATALHEIADSGLPYCLQLRPGVPEGLEVMAAARGMVKEDPIPLMVLESDDRLRAALQVADLKIRQLESDEAALHATIAAAGFEAPEELFVQFITPEMLRVPGTRCYAGERGRETVTTGMGLTRGESVGIFNIATPPVHRGKGFGAAVTARAVADGLAAGARWSYLQSSPYGFRVYERLGYSTIEEWDCWITSF